MLVSLRTVGIIEQFIHLPSKHLRGLATQAASQLDTQIGSAVLLNGFEGDDDDMPDSDRRGDVDDAPVGESFRQLQEHTAHRGNKGLFQAVSSGVTGFFKPKPLQNARGPFRRSSRSNRVQPLHVPKFKNSWKFVSTALAKFTIPLVVVGIWLVFLYMSTVAFRQQSKALQGWIRLMMEYSQASQIAVASILPYALTGDTLTEKSLPQHWADYLSVAVPTERLFYHGGFVSDLEGTVPPLSRDSTQFRLLFTDACQGLTLESTNPATGECYRAITLGYASASLLLLQTSRDLMGVMDRDYAGTATVLNPGTACRGPGSVAAAQLMGLWALQVLDIVEVQQALMDTFLDSLHDATAAYSALVDIVVSVFVIGFVVLVIGLSVTTIRDITRVLHLSVSMILLVPEYVLLDNPELLRMVVNLAKSNDGLQHSTR